MSPGNTTFQRWGARAGQVPGLRGAMIWLSGFKRLQKLVYGRTNPISPWEEDEEFKQRIAPVRTRTLVQPPALYSLYQLARQARTVAGDVAEVGVYKGGTARLFADLFVPAGKRVHLFDTFEGMPDTASSTKDFHKAGDFSDTSLESVRAFVGAGPQVEFHPGFFPASLPPSLGDSAFAFVHVDVDIHQSVLDACAFFYPRLASGGVMVFDDYGFLSCPGAKQAVDDFFADKPEIPLYLATAQAVVFKR